MKTTFALIALLFANSAFAGDTVQFIDCRYPNPESNDHVVVSLKDSQNGTFFYTTGFDDNGDSHNTGKLSLTRIADKKDLAQFTATWKTIQDGGVVLVEFLFSMPKNMVFKSGDFIKAGLSSTITDALDVSLHSDDELTCYARLYPANQTKN